MRFEVREVFHDPDPLVYRIAIAATGRHSGAPVEIELCVVAELRDGLLWRQRNFSSREEALDAARLPG